MKVTDVDIIPVFPRVVPRHRDKYAYYGSVSRLTVFRVRTDAGIVGYGEMRGAPPPESTVAPVIGRDPFDFVNSTLNHGLVAALYDVMGKHLDVPAYKLMGQKCRDAVSVAAWTRPCSPEEFRGEVRHAVDQGYTILKMHTNARYDVMEQTRLAEEVGTAIDASLGMADLYMIDSGGIGGTLARGIALGLLNTQVMFQLVGNALSKALCLHMAAVLPTATGHCVNQDDSYEEDLVVERIPVTEGFSMVPEKPGLGVEVDEEALQRLAANPDPYESIARNIGILALPYGKKLYTISFPDVQRATGTEEGAIRGIAFEFRQDDGSDEFQQLYERLEREGPFTE